MVKPEALSTAITSLLLSREHAELLQKHGFSVQLRLLDSQGQPLSSQTLTAFMSELRAVQQKIEHARRLVQTGALAAAVTHEIRNLLTGSLGFAQLLRTKSYDAAKVKDTALLIETELRRCVDVVASFLKLSRSGMEATRELTVAEIIAPVERLVTHSVQQRGCVLQVDIDRELPMVLGRTSDLQRVFINLVMNAADAAHAPGRGIILSARLGVDGNVELRVADDGPGIPDAIAERIFEPFFSTKLVGEGTGLGLAISRGIAESHGGTLVVEPKLTPGATFLLRLPPAGRRLDGRPVAGTSSGVPS